MSTETSELAHEIFSQAARDCRFEPVMPGYQGDAVFPGGTYPIELTEDDRELPLIVTGTCPAKEGHPGYDMGMIAYLVRVEYRRAAAHSVPSIAYYQAEAN